MQEADIKNEKCKLSEYEINYNMLYTLKVIE